jgi:tRNA (guanine37-N1)-methyltransferase
MKYIMVEPRNADKARRLMMRLNVLDSSRTVIHSRSYVYFPTLDIKHAKVIKLIGGLGAKMVTRKERANRNGIAYEKLVEKAIGKVELSKLSKGYDQIGDIAIIEFKGRKENAKKIADILMGQNSSIKTVLAKAGAVSGRYRIRKVRYVSGTRNYIANYKENNCIFRFDVRKTYFSNRLSFERSRILKLVRSGESVMVMFAGVGPFAIEIAKNISKTNVLAIELNKSAYSYMLGNIKLNKLHNMHAILGDVKKVAGKYRNSSDRIIMPLPKSSLGFLDQAYRISKRKAIVHLYAFSSIEDPFNKICEAVKDHAKKTGYRVRILNKRMVRPYSAKECEIVVDYRILKD